MPSKQKSAVEVKVRQAPTARRVKIYLIDDVTVSNRVNLVNPLPYIGDEGKKNPQKLMATHGSVSAFDPSKEDWTSYEERLRYYFVANDVTDGAKKPSILLAACGAPAYKLIRSLVQAEKLDWFLLGTGRMPHPVGGAMGVTWLHRGGIA